MLHQFKFGLGQPVVALDYDNPRREHLGTVVRRWLDEKNRDLRNPQLTGELVESYEVLVVEQGVQSCHFVVDDLTEVRRI